MMRRGDLGAPDVSAHCEVVFRGRVGESAGKGSGLCHQAPTGGGLFLGGRKRMGSWKKGPLCEVEKMMRHRTKEEHFHRRKCGRSIRIWEGVKD